jgi:hypothetical protein
VALRGEDPFDYSGDDNQPPDDSSLSVMIEAGDVNAVRKYFDIGFWKGWQERPGWKHLKLALRREDKPVLKLLITWGASATEDELAQFRVTAKDKYRGYIKLLRQCGLPLSATAMEDIPYAEPEAPVPDAGLIPEEWKKVLRAAQDLGAGEAVIAGGSLRDLFNNRAIKDVDIFLKSRGSEKKNREFLKNVFNASGLEITAQSYESDGYSTNPIYLPDPKKDGLSIQYKEGYDTIIKESRAESWKVIAGPSKTEYNVVFVGDAKLSDWASIATLEDKRFGWTLISGFDLGLCQIAYDGKVIPHTCAYDHDVKYRQITLQNPNDKSKEHLQRIAKKYPDWELCAKSRKLLAKKPPSDDWMMYSVRGFGW